jgi:hypothetical protein
VIVILGCVYLGVEIVIGMLGRPALLASPTGMIDAVTELGSTPPAVPVAVGIVLLVVGAIIIIASLAPGRRARHQMVADRAGVVVDNEVVASSLARTASHAGAVDPDETSVSVAKRRAFVRLIPTTGSPVRRDDIESAVEGHLEQLQLQPAVTAVVSVAARGRIGA